MRRGLVVWGLVAHLIADWPLQSDWMARNKAWPWRWSILGLLPAFTHAGIHAVALGVVFGYWPGMALGLAHLLIDTRVPVAWFSKVMRQTPPDPAAFPLMDIGATVRFWVDQVWHVACIAIAALIVTA
jgi:hypothetical protein